MTQDDACLAAIIEVNEARKNKFIKRIHRKPCNDESEILNIKKQLASTYIIYNTLPPDSSPTGCKNILLNTMSSLISKLPIEGKNMIRLNI